MSLLDEILASTRDLVAAQKRERSLESIRADLVIRTQHHRFSRSLHGPDIRLIAEFKRCSPSKGALNENADVASTVRTYERGGASAISVLTAPSFGGSLNDLQVAQAACDLPVLRKDFIIDPYQLYQAAEAGADAVLLIASVLPDQLELAELHGVAGDLGLEALVEIRDGSELKRALAVGATLIGINNRDLETFTIDLGTTKRLVQEIPSEITVVAESGLTRRSELDELARLKIHAALIGSALMTAPDPLALCVELTQQDVRSTATVEASQPALA